MKKILLAFLLCSTPLFAATYKGEPAAQVGLRNGPYLGGQIGFDSFRIHQNINLGSGLLTSNPTLNVTGSFGGVILGYGRYFENSLYLGGEVQGNYSDASINYAINDQVTSYHAKMTAAGGVNFAFLPGYKITPYSVIYLRLGYNWDRMKIEETIPSMSVNTVAWSHRIAYGMGLESLFYKNWGVRLEYSHTNNNSFKSWLAARTNFNMSDN